MQHDIKQHTLTLLPEERTSDFLKDELLIDILEETSIHVPSPCGGKGLCGKCVVTVQGDCSEKTDAEWLFLKEQESRLACQARAIGDVAVNTESIASETDGIPLLLSDTSTYGLAVDIGTTSIQIALIDLGSSESRIIASFLNPQRRYGYDVISRIYASSETRIHEKLVRILRSEIASVLSLALKKLAIGDTIVSIAFSGNTVMSHYLTALDVHSLGVFPYRAACLDFDFLSPSDLGLPLADTTKVFVNPAASAFLGGDLVGGLALLDAMGLTEHLFFVDLGTNGEMFLRADDCCSFAASCAMGPALEGMNMSSGMTAAEGAISHFRQEEDALVPEVIGGTFPRGITGTGIIDLVALLRGTGLIDSSGLLVKQKIKECSIKGIGWDEESRSVKICDAITLTQKDIRNVQLAKGASLAASTVLLKESGIAPESIRTVVIAGAFGEHLNIEHFQSLTFIADFPNAEYIFLGNTSLKSAEATLRDTSFMARMKRLRDSIRIVELNSIPDFNDLFIQSLNFRR